MKRLWPPVLPALLAVCLLAGCQSSASVPVPQYSAAPAATAAAMASAALGDKDASQPQSQDTGTGAAMPVLDPGNAAQSGKKMIYTVLLSLEVAKIADAIDDITASAAAAGGYVSQSAFSDNEQMQEGSITVRLPPERLREFTERLRQNYKALSSLLSSEDITDRYVDLQSRLTNAQAQETQLLGIMKQAVKVDDILKVRQELNTVQQEIEQIKGQLRLMDNQVGYSTVHISLSVPPPVIVPEVKKDEGVVQLLGLRYTWESMQKNFLNGLYATLNAMSGLLTVLSVLIIPLLAVAVVVLAILLPIRLVSRRRRKP